MAAYTVCTAYNSFKAFSASTASTAYSAKTAQTAVTAYTVSTAYTVYTTFNAFSTLTMRTQWNICLHILLDVQRAPLIWLYMALWASEQKTGVEWTGWSGYPLLRGPYRLL